MSTSEGKKKSSASSKRSSKEDDVPIEQVHTANNWEKADLGDNERKQKFLRLMGAKVRAIPSDQSVPMISSRNAKMVVKLMKNWHRPMPRSPFQKRSIADPVSCPRSLPKSTFLAFLETDTETINRDLEKQFNESLQSKLMHTHHGGLGFSEGSSSHDWHQPSKKLTFVPAATAPSDHAVTTDKEKPEKKKKS